MTNVSLLEQKAEAVKRMKKLKLIDNIIYEFEEKDVLNRSERGILYWLTDEEKNLVKTWEKETGNLVYHVIRNKMEFGLCYSLLYVSQHVDEWAYDNEDLTEGFPFVYVINVDDIGCSEYGRIGVKNFFGGLLRTA